MALTRETGGLQKRLVKLARPGVGAAPKARSMDHLWKGQRTFPMRQRTDLRRDFLTRGKGEPLWIERG